MPLSLYTSDDDPGCLIEVTTTAGPYLIPCPNEQFALGALLVLRSLDPQILQSLAPTAPRTQTPDLPLPAPQTKKTGARLPPKPPKVRNRCKPPEQLKQPHTPKGARPPEGAPATWKGLLALDQPSRLRTIRDYLALGWTRNGVARHYGVQAGQVDKVLARAQK